MTERENVAIAWEQARRFHLVGIGGIGMSGLAELLLGRGFEVSGSDLQESPLLERLSRLGARIQVGHRAEHLKEGADVVVFSSAVAHDNTELAVAREQGMVILSRGELLARLMSQKRGISIAGTHGKTTTTAMMGAALLGGQLDPTILVGARFDLIGSNALEGGGEWFVAEADESDRSFLLLRPECAVVTNIDLDHMDEYHDPADLEATFLEHMRSVPQEGLVVACGDDQRLAPLLKKLHRRVVTYGLGPGVHLQASGLELGWSQSGFDCHLEGERLGHVELAVPGRHNILNALAVIAVGRRLLKLPFEVIAGSLKDFRGVERRLQWKGEKEGVRVVDDYGHHPEEVRVTLDACRLAGLRTVVLFQPHRYSRTQSLMQELARSFEEADALYLLDIYPAGEDPIPGVSSGRLAEEIRRHRPVTYLQAGEDAVTRLRKETRPGDLLLTLGAGDVWKIGEAFLE